MLKKKFYVFDYVLNNIIEALLCCFIFGYYYAVEFSSLSYGLFGVDFLLLGFAVYALLYVATAVFNGFFLRNVLGCAVNAFLPTAILNTVILFEKAGFFAILTVVGAVAVIAIFTFTSGYIKTHNSKLINIFFVSEDTDGGEVPAEESTDSEKPAGFTGLWQSFAGKSIAYTLILALAMLALGIFSTHYYRYYNDNLMYSDVYMDADTVSEFTKLESRQWKKLTVEERCALIQEVCNSEAIRMGLPETPEIFAVALGKNDAMYGVHYNEESNVIEIDYSKITKSRSGYSAVKATAHGIYLAYEYAKQEMVDYVTSSSAELSSYGKLFEFERYGYNNKFDIEMKASRYSELVTSEYRRKVSQYKLDADKEYYR